MSASEPPRAGIDGAFALPTLMARQMTELQGEMWRFLAQRLNADAAAFQAALACRSMTDLLQVQQDWAQQASTDYAGEAERVLDLASQPFDTLHKAKA